MIIFFFHLYFENLILTTSRFTYSCTCSHNNIFRILEKKEQKKEGQYMALKRQIRKIYIPYLLVAEHQVLNSKWISNCMMIHEAIHVFRQEETFISMSSKKWKSASVPYWFDKKCPVFVIIWEFTVEVPQAFLSKFPYGSRSDNIFSFVFPFLVSIKFGKFIIYVCFFSLCIVEIRTVKTFRIETYWKYENTPWISLCSNNFLKWKKKTNKMLRIE